MLWVRAWCCPALCLSGMSYPLTSAKGQPQGPPQMHLSQDKEVYFHHRISCICQPLSTILHLQIMIGMMCYSGAVHCPRYTGEFDQPPMVGLVSWVWLGIHTGVTTTNDREEPLLTFTTFIEHHHHHIITSLHHYIQVDTSHGLQVYTSVQNNKIQ